MFCHLVEETKDQHGIELNSANHQLVCDQAQLQHLLFLGKSVTPPLSSGHSLAGVIIKIMEIFEGEPPGKLYWNGLVLASKAR